MQSFAVLQKRDISFALLLQVQATRHPIICSSTDLQSDRIADSLHSLNTFFFPDGLLGMRLLGPSTSAQDEQVEDDERAPLLAHRESGSEGVEQETTNTKLRQGGRVDPGELQDALTPEERRRSLLKWLAFWLVFGVFVLILVILSIKQGGARFEFKDALKKAAGGGVAGAAAMIIQVLTLMPLRTTMNYQYRYGGTTVQSIKKLWHDGGFRR